MDFLNKIKLFYLYIFLFVFSGCLYLNSVNNEYALDDDIVILQNGSVQKGIAGIKEIFSQDMFAPFAETNEAEGNSLSGGRYRPLSIATFAVEQQFTEFNPAPRHVVNVLLYCALVLLIFSFVLNDLKLNVLTAFCAAFIFALHPLHTEVVANIKSRDEILSLIFYLLTISCYLKYLDNSKIKNLLKTLGCFIAALLSKEYAITLLLVLPVAAFTLRNYKTGAALKSMWAPALVFLLYALIRAKIVGWSAPEQTDPLNNPYIYATGIEKFATKIYILLKYMLLLVKPFPLSADYSYAQIQFRTFADWDVWASAVLNVLLIFYTVRSVLKRKLIGLLCVIYLSNLFLVSNFLFNIGASMGERFLFHSSFAFCVAVSLGIDLLKTKMKISVFTFAVIVFLAGISVISVLIIIPRNRDWKNSYTLFLKDVQTSPNSALCNANAASALANLAMAPENSLQKDSLLKEAIAHSNKAIKIHPGFSNAFFNHAVCDYYLANYDSAFVYWEKGFVLFNSEPHKAHFSELVYKKALTEGEQKHFETAIKLLEWSVKISPDNAAWWSDLGGAYFSVNRLQDAKACWEKALSIDPNDAQASKALPYINQKLSEAVK